TVADQLSLLVTLCTWIFVASAITWLLVSTRPSDVRIMPVPAPRPDVNVTLMSTIEGSTFCAMSDALRVPPCEPLELELELEGDGSASDLEADPVAVAEGEYVLCASDEPTP